MTSMAVTNNFLMPLTGHTRAWIWQQAPTWMWCFHPLIGCPFQSHSVDVIVSGQAFEHIEFFWLTWLEMTRILKPGGLIFLVAPSRGPEHRYPQDCWRFYPDGYRALASFGGLELVSANTDWESHADEFSAPWGDTVGVFRQPAMGFLIRMKKIFIQNLRYWLVPGYRI